MRYLVLKLWSEPRSDSGNDLGFYLRQFLGEAWHGKLSTLAGCTLCLVSRLLMGITGAIIWLIGVINLLTMPLKRSLTQSV